MDVGVVYWEGIGVLIVGRNGEEEMGSGCVDEWMACGSEVLKR